MAKSKTYKVWLEFEITSKGDEEVVRALFTSIVLMDSHFPFRGIKLKEKKLNQ